MAAALKQLDIAITDLRSAADEGNQKEAESAIKDVEAALQLKSQYPTLRLNACIQFKFDRSQPTPVFGRSLTVFLVVKQTIMEEGSVDVVRPCEIL